jgi:DNA polymerase-3 subunit delta
MARGPGRAAPAEGLPEALEEIRAGRPAAIYLLEGDPFLTQRGARQLAEALVPETQRALNLVELDAAASPGEVAAELATGGLFVGSKVVVVCEPAFLQSKEDAGAAFQRASDLWAAGRQREAARRLVAIAAKLGWSASDLDPARGGVPSPGEWARELDLAEPGLRASDVAFLEEAGRYAAERNLQAGKDDAGALEEQLATGLPPGHVLVVAAGKVDGRLPLVKRLAAAGRRITLAVAMEGAWDDQRPVLGELAASLLAGTGKSLDRGAEARLAELLGDDARALSVELAKLAAYAGERKVIRAEDVDAVTVRVAADPFFALGNAVEGRDLAGALGVLARTVADGGSPHMLVASLAGTVRRLLVERERGRRLGGGAPIASYARWQADVLPAISREELGNRKPYGLWMKYQASTRFSRPELLDALATLAEADHAMKTGADGVLLLERFLLGLLGTMDGERRTA